jgi:hypothetical protein
MKKYKFLFVSLLSPALLLAMPQLTLTNNFGQLYISKEATPYPYGFGILFEPGVGCRFSEYRQVGAQLSIKYYYDKFTVHRPGTDIMFVSEEAPVWEYVPHAFLRYDVLKRGNGALCIKLKFGASHVVSEARVRENWTVRISSWEAWVSPEIGISYSIPRTNMSISFSLGYDQRFGYPAGAYWNNYYFYTQQGLEVKLTP